MNVFDLAASLTLDASQFSEELTASEKLAKGFANMLGSAFGNGVKAVGRLTEQAVESYSAYQQLSGGVEQLFGNSAKIVTQFAQSAYKTAGINANKYLELATNFSAALISDLGGDTEKAAAYIDKAIVDMSDNVNTFGSSIESVSNAYKGFAKQEYRMLDNLKLGYGGTKKEMERLLQDASELSGQEYNISNLNDIIDAIHVIQDNLKITGKTVQESENTVEGAMKTARAAWDNLITEFGKPDGDIGARIKEWVDAAKVSAKNVLPVMKNVIAGLGEAISASWPEVKAVIGELWTVVEPVLQEVWSHLKETISGWMSDLFGGTVLGDIMGIPKVEKQVQQALNNTTFGATKATQGMGFFQMFNFLNQQGSAAMSEYTEQMEEVPEEVTTTATADVAGAIAGLKELADAAYAVPTSINIDAGLSGGYTGADPNGISDARSMSGGTILRGATMFGWDSDGIPHIGGGEGAEIVVGQNSLIGMLRETFAESVRSILSGMGGIITSNGGTRQPIQLVLDTGVLVAEIAPSMNSELSRIDTWRSGGDR